MVVVLVKAVSVSWAMCEVFGHVHAGCGMSLPSFSVSIPQTNQPTHLVITKPKPNLSLFELGGDFPIFFRVYA